MAHPGSEFRKRNLAGPRAALDYGEAMAIARRIPMQRVTMGPRDEDVARALVAAWADGAQHGKADPETGRELVQAYFQGAETARRAAAAAVRSLKDEDFVDEELAEIVEQIAVGIEGAELAPERTCRKCGCTDEAACEGGCCWVQADLCSACDESMGDDDAQNSFGG